MGNKKSVINSIGGLVWKCVWLFVSISFLIISLSWFFEDQTLGSWLFCGMLCSFPVIGLPLKLMYKSFVSGWNTGADDYEVTVKSSSIRVGNHPFRTALVWLVLTILFCLAVGPIYLTYKIVRAIIDVIIFIVFIIKEKKANTPTVEENHEVAKAEK